MYSNDRSSSAVVNFRIVSPAVVSEDIGQVEVCVEQMNGELGEEIEVSLRTSPVGTTASGEFNVSNTQVNGLISSYSNMPKHSLETFPLTWIRWQNPL